MTRRVTAARWDDLPGHLLRFEITANAFCHQMVRSIVGTMVDAGLGRRRPGELLAMLHSYTIPAPVAGSVKYRLKIGEFVNPGTLVGRIGTVEIRSPIPGAVLWLKQRDGAEVRAGEPLVELSADKEHAWEALRGLLRVGQKQDLDDVQRYARGVAGMPDRVRRQAALTLQEIRSRAQCCPHPLPARFSPHVASAWGGRAGTNR